MMALGVHCRIRLLLLPLCGFVLGNLVSVVALAQSTDAFLTDPTRPPGSFGTAPEGFPSGEGKIPGEAQLQSIILSSGRKLAIIGGVAYKAGDRVGDARVLSIEGESVRLRDGSGVRTLRLSPALETSGSLPVGDSVKSTKGAAR